MGHPIIIGRKTHESIGKPLPGRTNIVITRADDFDTPGCVVVSSLENAIAEAQKVDREEIFIFGGGQVYEQALPVTDRLYLTLINDKKDGDTFFPEYTNMFTKKMFEEEHEHEGLQYRWVTLERG
jgi:dihydrofolate reductase